MYVAKETTSCFLQGQGNNSGAPFFLFLLVMTEIYNNNKTLEDGGSRQKALFSFLNFSIFSLVAREKKDHFEAILNL